MRGRLLALAKLKAQAFYGFRGKYGNFREPSSTRAVHIGLGLTGDEDMLDSGPQIIDCDHPE